MTESRQDRNVVQRAVERRGELRYDGSLSASFTYAPSSLGGDTRTADCHVTSLSASSAVIQSSVHGQIGDLLWLHIEGFGVVRCEVESLRDDGFVCTSRLNADARKRLGARVSWLRRRGGRLEGGNREFMRTHPRDARTVITFDVGSLHPGKLSNVSRSGAAVVTDRSVSVGEAIAVGHVPARVVRILDGGFAVVFDVVLTASDADRLVEGYEVTASPTRRAM